MKITIESTTRLCRVMNSEPPVMARMWEGFTEDGIPVQVLVTRIAAPGTADQSRFVAQFQEHKAPENLDAQAFPLRMVI